MSEKLLICCQEYYFMIKNVFETFQISLFILFFIIFLILLIRIGILNASPALLPSPAWKKKDKEADLEGFKDIFHHEIVFLTTY